MEILVYALQCFNHFGRKTGGTCFDSKHCVFKQIGLDEKTAERRCEESSDLEFKKFYNITDTGCILCGSSFGCQAKNKTIDLKDEELVCFCNTDKCNSYCRKNESCKTLETDFEPRDSIMERCDPRQVCGLKIDQTPISTSEGTRISDANNGETVTHGNEGATKNNENGGKTSTDGDEGTIVVDGDEETTAAGGSKAIAVSLTIISIMAFILLYKTRFEF